jgi:hypothetical protein
MSRPARSQRAPPSRPYVTTRRLRHTARRSAARLAQVGLAAVVLAPRAARLVIIQTGARCSNALNADAALDAAGRTPVKRGQAPSHLEPLAIHL